MRTLPGREFAELCTVSLRTIRQDVAAGRVQRESPGRYRPHQCAHYEFRRLRLFGTRERIDEDGLQHLEMTFRQTLVDSGFKASEVDEEVRLYSALLRSLNRHRGPDICTVCFRSELASKDLEENHR